MTTVSPSAARPARISEIEAFEPAGYPQFTFTLALWNAVQGNDERALDMLELAVGQGFRGALQMRMYRPFERFRDDARFRQLLATIDADLAVQKARAVRNGWIYSAPQTQAPPGVSTVPLPVTQ